MSKGKSHSFSIILVMILLMVVGAIFLVTGQLKVQYNPVQENLNLSVSFFSPYSSHLMSVNDIKYCLYFTRKDSNFAKALSFIVFG